MQVTQSSCRDPLSVWSRIIVSLRLDGALSKQLDPCFAEMGSIRKKDHYLPGSLIVMEPLFLPNSGLFLSLMFTVATSKRPSSPTAFPLNRSLMSTARAFVPDGKPFY